MKHRVFIILAGIAAAALVLASCRDKPAPVLSPEEQLIVDYHQRCDQIIDFYSNRINASDNSQGTYFDIIARLRTGSDLKWVLKRLDVLMNNPSGDMFWMFPFVITMFEGRETLPDAYRANMRRLWDTYTPYRGDTENHFLMYYASLYLVTELYPDEPGTDWFTGKSSEENHAEAEEYLEYWFDTTTTVGQGEFDSPRYIGFYIGPMAMLYAYAEDELMRKRAGMMLDYLLADFAVDSLDGFYTGAFSRMYPTPLFERQNENSTSLAWLVFGNTPESFHATTLVLAISGYEPPEILHHIATDRSTPYVHRELKRSRDFLRNTDIRSAPAYKYAYMTEDYAMGSIQGRPLQGIQQHTWELFWTTNIPAAHFTLLFTVHPYSSPLQGTTYFSEPWNMVTELIVRSKTEYDSPDKWTGGSPYEQIVQHEDAVIALYDIPEGTRFPHISAFFSSGLSSREEDESGWIFTQGGRTYIAYYPLAPYEFIRQSNRQWRLHSPYLKNGAIVQAASIDEFRSFDDFKARMRSLRIVTSMDPVPSVQYTTLRGSTIQATYGEIPIVNGTPVDYDSWPLFEGPFLNAEVGSKKLDMRYGTQVRTLDFENLTVTDRTAD